MGAASFIGHLLEDFTSEEQLLSTCMATIRLFDRLGNRDNMARNRMRYLVNEIGWEKFQKMVLKERAIVEMTVSEFTKNLYQVNFDDSYVPLKKSTKYNNLPIVETNISTTSNGYDWWLHTNVVPQKQENYFTIFITLGAGDITSSQLRSLALLIRKFSSESIARNTPQQNFAIRYITTMICQPSIKNLWLLD